MHRRRSGTVKAANAQCERTYAQGLSDRRLRRRSAGLSTSLSSPYAVRRANPGDVNGLASLVEHYWAFENIDGFDRARIQTLLAGVLVRPEQGSCWVAESGGVLCSYLLLVYVFSLEHGGLMAEIDEFFVLPAHRSNGIGAKLLCEAEAALRTENLVSLQLQLGNE